MTNAKSAADYLRLQIRYGFRKCVGLEGPLSLYRARDISALSVQDVGVLHALGITTVLDLRNDSERAGSPYSTLITDSFDVCVYGLNLRQGARPCTSFSHDIRNAYGPPGHRMLAQYKEMARHSGELEGLARRLAHAEGASLVHCVNGKDRSGVFCAYIQAQNGVSPAAIMEDYLVTNSFNREMNDRDLQARWGAGSKEEQGVLRAMFEARPEYLEAFFENLPESSRTRMQPVVACGPQQAGPS